MRRMHNSFCICSGGHMWNNDPFGDIACFVTGLTAEKVSADMVTFAEGREVFDNAYLTLVFKEGVRGRIWSSYVAAGHDHGLRFQIFGESGNLAWEQESPEELWHIAPRKSRKKGSDELVKVEILCRNPAGPEGLPGEGGNRPEASIGESSEMAASSVCSQHKSRVIEPRNI